jgi:tetratricopeptide (TPR) repeat protein
LWLKRKDYKQVIKFVDDALEVDHKYTKALFLKGRALLEMTEYTKAIETFKDLLEFEPDNEEAKRELLKSETINRKY